jgi:hypothetical protein
MHTTKGDDMLNTCHKSAAATSGDYAERRGGGGEAGMREEGEVQPMDPAESQAEGESQQPMTFGRCLRRARMAKQWSQLQLAHRMRQVGAEHRGAATVASLIIMLSKWENDRKDPNQYNLHLLAEALEVSVESLNLPIDPDFVF